jgi:hypothetical protein
MSTKPNNAARIGNNRQRQSRSVRPSSLLVLAKYNWRVYSSAGAGGLRRMGSLIVRRRQFLRGLASLAVCAPAVVRASSLMGISASACFPPGAVTPWATPQDALALLQHEMERRFAESLFGEHGRAAEADCGVPMRSPVAAEANMTALWELRTLFGPRGSPPKALEDLPTEVQAGLFSMFGPSPGVTSDARGA